MNTGFRIHLLDGTYELFRAFYGAPSRLTSSGEEVGATLGFVRSVLGLLQGGDVTHIACAFDHVIESFRNDLFAGYKTGAGVDPLILSQFSLVEDAARAMGVAYWPMIEFEADDALASAAAQWSRDPRVSQILICTPGLCISGVIAKTNCGKKITDNPTNKNKLILNINTYHTKLLTYKTIICIKQY